MILSRRFSWALLSQFLSTKTLSISSNSILFKTLTSMSLCEMCPNTNQKKLRIWTLFTLFIMLSVLNLHLSWHFLNYFLIRFAAISIFGNTDTQFFFTNWDIQISLFNIHPWTFFIQQIADLNKLFIKVLFGVSFLEAISCILYFGAG